MCFVPAAESVDCHSSRLNSLYRNCPWPKEATLAMVMLCLQLLGTPHPMIGPCWVQRFIPLPPFEQLEGPLQLEFGTGKGEAPLQLPYNSTLPSIQCAFPFSLHGLCLRVFPNKLPIGKYPPQICF